jgi:hypothetical protein
LKKIANRRAAHDTRRTAAWIAVAVACLFGCAPGSPRAMSVPASAFPDPQARAFIEAVEAGDVARAIDRARALREGVNAVGTQGETALLLAVARLDKPMVTALLTAGADPDGGPDRSPLAMAAQAKDVWFAKTLLKANASPEATSGGESPLFRAILVNRLDMIDLLLEAGAKPDAVNAMGVAPSMTAAKIDDFQAVLRLLDRGASPFAADPRGMSLAYLTGRSYLASDNPQGRARDQVAARLQSAGVPWPPPSPQDLLALKAAGRWPPRT